MAPVQKEVHANAEEKQRYQESVAGQEVNTMLISQEQTGHGEEYDQDDGCARGP